MNYKGFLLISVFCVAALACGTCPPDVQPDAGPDADPVCDQHPELALIESMPCAVDADCPVITACVSIICGPASTCTFGVSPPNGTSCEAGGACNDRRCCHPTPVGP